jgi:hypothetical protein
MAWCMLRGLKPVETRPQPWWKPGWYYLHVGAEPIRSDCLAPLKDAPADLPAERAMPRSCIVGMVLIAKSTFWCGWAWCAKSLAHMLHGTWRNPSMQKF